ncbi:GDP-mannose 4,6-dehydratase, partial [Streptomyces sp. DSM 15324]|uniref:GDP-mannose 4,6-dehydratase n=1 Tax=Streptomyces sp. DSM 15324 TaxID=1739111 RepID=UPI000AEF7F69
MTTTPLAAVTGAEGFIGSHLTEALVASGHRVRAMAQYNSFSSYGWLETLHPDVLDQVEIVLGDVRDPGSVHGLLEGADTVY